MLRNLLFLMAIPLALAACSQSTETLAPPPPPMVVAPPSGNPPAQRATPHRVRDASMNVGDRKRNLVSTPTQPNPQDSRSPSSGGAGATADAPATGDDDSNKLPTRKNLSPTEDSFPDN